MRKEGLFSIARFFTLGIVITSLLFTAGCRGDDYEEQIAEMARQQTRLELERDSLLQVVADQDRLLKEMEAAKGVIDEEVVMLTASTNSLSATAASRGEQLKTVTREKTETAMALEKETEKRTALEEELSKMREQEDTLNQEVNVCEQEKLALEARAEAAKAERIKADSIAATNLQAVLDAQWKPHFVNKTELIAGYGLGDVEPDYTRTILGVSHVFGYAFTGRFTGGIGTGAWFYNGGTLVPLFLDFRYKFGGNDYKPFIEADGGLLFNFSDFDSSVAFVNPSLGLKKRLNEHLALHLSAGPLIQYTPDGGHRASFIVAKAGISF